MTPFQARSSSRLLAGHLIKAHMPTLCPLHASSQTGPSPPSLRAEAQVSRNSALTSRVLAFQIRKPRRTVQELISHVLTVRPDSHLSEVQPPPI